MGVANPLSLARARALFASITGVIGDFSARIIKADQPGFFRRDHIGFNVFESGGVISVEEDDGPSISKNGINKFITLYDGLFLPAQNPIFEADIKVEGVSDVSYEVGFGDKDYNDIIAFYYDTNAYGISNWHVIWNAWVDDIELTAANSADGNDHPPNTLDFEKLRIEVVSATSIKFYIDDVLVYTATNNINTSPLPAQINIFGYNIQRLSLFFRHVLARQNAFL